MDNLKEWKKATDLGKLIVKELKLDPGVDTLSRWMAHYIAERMQQVEELNGKAKSDAKKECFELILKLWDHRWSMSHDNRPLEAYEPLMKVLERLDPERDQYLFFRENPPDNLLDYSVKGKKKEMDQLINGAINIDRIARVWIEFLLNEAATLATTNTTKQWLENAVILPRSFDVQIIRSVLDSPANPVDEEQRDRQRKAEVLKKRILELDKFSELNSMLLDKYSSKLNEVTSDNKQTISKKISK